MPGLLSPTAAASQPVAGVFEPLLKGIKIIEDTRRLIEFQNNSYKPSTAQDGAVFHIIIKALSYVADGYETALRTNQSLEASANKAANTVAVLKNRSARMDEAYTRIEAELESMKSYEKQASSLRRQFLQESVNLRLDLEELQKQIQPREDALDRETQRTTALLALLNKHTGHFYLMNDHDTSHFERYLNMCDQALAKGSAFSEEKLLNGSLALAEENRDCLMRREQQKTRLGVAMNGALARAPLQLFDSKRQIFKPSAPSTSSTRSLLPPSSITTSPEQRERSTSPTISVGNSNIEEDGRQDCQEPDSPFRHANLILESQLLDAKLEEEERNRANEKSRRLVIKQEIIQPLITLENIVSYELDSNGDENSLSQVKPGPIQPPSTPKYAGSFFEDAREDIPLEIAIFGSGSDISDGDQCDGYQRVATSSDQRQPPVSPLWMRFELPEEILPPVSSLLSDEECPTLSTQLPPISSHSWGPTWHPSLKRSFSSSSSDEEFGRGSDGPVKRRKTSSTSSSSAAIRRIPATRFRRARSSSSEKRRQSQLVQTWLETVHHGIERINSDTSSIGNSSPLMEPSHLGHEFHSSSECSSEVDELADDHSLVDSGQGNSSRFAKELSPESEEDNGLYSSGTDFGARISVSPTGVIRRDRTRLGRSISPREMLRRRVPTPPY